MVRLKSSGGLEQIELTKSLINCLRNFELLLRGITHASAFSQRLVVLAEQTSGLLQCPVLRNSASRETILTGRHVRRIARCVCWGIYIKAMKRRCYAPLHSGVVS